MSSTAASPPVAVGVADKQPTVLDYARQDAEWRAAGGVVGERTAPVHDHRRKSRAGEPRPCCRTIAIADEGADEAAVLGRLAQLVVGARKPRGRRHAVLAGPAQQARAANHQHRGAR